ncbi:MAG: ATP-binding cassette domain-containing protein, partial [Hyphomicrobiaceae bacterium]|nr:ATP-binding cassette domain-containing protein [Hyphomicrobiaceae bacterium]
ARLHHYPGQLSGGERRRVAIARARVHAPRVVLADEPTGNLDTKTGQQIVELLFGLKERTGATLVLVTHDVRLANMTERVIGMGDGRILSENLQTPAERVAAQ